MPKSSIQPKDQFGRLTVIALDTETPRTHRSYLWWCQCVCGNITSVMTYSLKKKNGTRSCGCLRKDTTKTHGMWGSPEHRAWHDMKQRVRPTKNYASTYSDKNITVCPEWDSFEVFFAHVGKKPSPRHTLDRYPDGDGNYEPGNVRWATHAEQNRNTSRNVWITFDGVTLCRKDWALRTGIKDRTIKDRLSRNWTIERALTTPVKSPPRERQRSPDSHGN